MAKDPAYPMYAQDFDMDTADWGIDEIGVYIRLLNYEWINGYVPNNLDRISKIARISPRKLQKIWEIISKKFSPNGTHTLQNKRMEEEREKRNKYIESQRKSGKKGAEKRWKEHSEPNGDPIDKPNGEKIALHSHSHSQSSTLVIKENNKRKFNQKEFDVFIAIYPNPKSKKEALERWKKLIKSDELPKLEILLTAIKEQISWRQNANGDFRPEWKNPATWLNKGCWEDEVVENKGGQHGFQSNTGKTSARSGSDGEEPGKYSGIGRTMLTE